jgi:hypothetical protein
MLGLISRIVEATRRSVMSLLFVALAFLSVHTQVSASSVAASGTFAGTNYQVVPGDSLLDTGTHFSFINNFSVPITVNFVFEAPAGVTVLVPSGLVTVPANGSYRFDIQITTVQSVEEGVFPIRINGLVVPDSASGVEVSGSAGLNAQITIQGLPPTTPPSVVLMTRSDTSAIVEVTNDDFETVFVLYDLGINPPTTPTPELNTGSGLQITFSGLEANTIYTVFFTATAVNRDESDVVSFSFTTLPTPIPPEDPDDPIDEPDDPVDDPVPSDPQPAPPTTGGFTLTNVLFIELSSTSIVVPVFGEYVPPQMNAYVSVRAGVRETSRIDLTNRVVVTGSVNTSLIGRYEVRYTVRYLTQTLVEVVEVFVVDQEAPRILSPEEITILVDDPFVYELRASDNYDAFSDLIVTGFPSVVDTSVVGTQRFSVVITDQSGNRTPFLFTVNVRERQLVPITITINNQSITFVAVEGLFNPQAYVIDVSVMVNPPLPNSPSWVRFTGQELTPTGREAVYIRLTDDRGRTLQGVVDLSTGELLPSQPDETVIEPDPWWRVLFRTPNLWIWLLPLSAFLITLWWFFFFLAKRRKEEEEEEPEVDVQIDSLDVSGDEQKVSINHVEDDETLIDFSKAPNEQVNPPKPSRSPRKKAPLDVSQPSSENSDPMQHDDGPSKPSSSRTKKKS